MSMLHVNYLTGGGDNDGGVKGNKAGKPVTTVRVCYGICKHDTNPNQVVFVPKPNQSISTALRIKREAEHLI